MPHKLSGYRVRRRSISPASFFPGLLLALPSTSRLSAVLALNSGWTSANMFVVASDTRLSHARAVRAYEEKLCGVQTPGSARILGMNRLVAT
jgi:hypothetical protein